MVVTWPWGICLICPSRHTYQAYISGKSPHGHGTTIICNTFTPQIKGICCGLNVMYHIPQLSRCVTTSLVCYNFHWNVLQLPLECATTSHRNAYNYATTSNGMLQKYQGALIQIPKTPLLIKQNISISIVGLS